MKALLFRRIQMSQGLTLAIALSSLVTVPGGCAVAAMQPSVEQASPETRIQSFGEVATPNQVGKGYVVFSQRGHQVVGAFYYPQSEFSCFVGQTTGNVLKVVPLEPDGEAAPVLDIALPQLHRMAAIGASERNALALCQQEAAQLQQAPMAIEAIR